MLSLLFNVYFLSLSNLPREAYISMHRFAHEILVIAGLRQKTEHKAYVNKVVAYYTAGLKVSYLKPSSKSFRLYPIN